MYNPSRGGVRGGADQFTWESVKNDKHRENYLGHSLMAPVGRWQKGKDLSWYAKERKDAEALEKSDKLASIKQAEEEAMLIALGHNIVRKEAQKLTKEEMREALKRNTTGRDEQNVERIDGVGASNKRLALLSNSGNNFRQNQEGVAFEGYKYKRNDVNDKHEENIELLHTEKKKCKKSKKLKKEKKHKKHRKESHYSDSSDGIVKHSTKHKRNESDSDYGKSSKYKQKSKRNSSNDSRAKYHSSYHQKNKKRHKNQTDSKHKRKYRHDSSDSN